jgi:selenocysteine lyase/cysteine desulfurase
MQDLEARITPKTRIIALSHVQFASGYTADLHELAKMCRAYDIDLVLDVAQSLGCVPIDVDDLGIAAAVSSGWKWLMGPMGTGLLYTSARFRQKLDPVIVGAEAMQQGTDYLDHTWNPFASAKCFEYSTAPIAIAAALECCVRELTLRYGADAICGEVRRLQEVFLGALDQTRIRPLFASRAQRSSILSLMVPDARSVCRALLKENVICTERGGYLRIAPHFYNTEDEMERVARILNAMA